MKASSFVSRFAVRLTITAVATAGFAGAALADPHWARSRVRYESQYREPSREPVYAKVVDVEPIMRRVRVTTPQRECWNETQPVYPSRPRGSAGSMILGGLIGGVIGHQFGHGDRHTPTLAGAVVGAAIGNEVGQQKAAERDAYGVPAERTVERCDVNYREDYEERIDGYRVTYVFDGREYTTRMPYDPGQRILIDVNVRPVVEGRY